MNFFFAGALFEFRILFMSKGQDRSSTYIFHRREISSIFILTVVISLFSFVLGVKYGKDYVYEEHNITSEDQKVVEMTSNNEEIMMEAEKEGYKEEPDKEKEELEKTIHKELKSRIEKDFIKKKTAKKISGAKVSIPKKMQDKFKGKGYTIQLGSYRTMKEASEFANGFKVRGYEPIINDVQLPKRGVWYRVSLGFFKTVADAKKYIIKENELFRSQDYVFVPF